MESGQRVQIWDSPNLVEEEKQFVGLPGRVVTAGRSAVVVRLDEPIEVNGESYQSYMTKEENLERLQ